MDKSKFENYVAAAAALDSDYSAGYRDGISRHYHGNKFITTLGHSEYMLMGLNESHRKERGDGYRDGFAGHPPRGVHGNIGNANAQRDLPADTTVQIRLNKAVKAKWEKHAGKGKVSAWLIELANADCERYP